MLPNHLTDDRPSGEIQTPRRSFGRNSAGFFPASLDAHLNRRVVSLGMLIDVEGNLSRDGIFEFRFRKPP